MILLKDGSFLSMPKLSVLGKVLGRKNKHWEVVEWWHVWVFWLTEVLASD